MVTTGGGDGGSGGSGLVQMLLSETWCERQIKKWRTDESAARHRRRDEADAAKAPGVI